MSSSWPRPPEPPEPLTITPTALDALRTIQAAVPVAPGTTPALLAAADTFTVALAVRRLRPR